jgi:hypothetical protein
MNANVATFAVPELPVLLRGEAAPIRSWIEVWSSRRFATHIALIVVGTAAFGAAIGWWRAPMQALYTAVKFPVILLLTAFGNALLNGMIAPLLGVNITFRQSLLSILMSFTIAAAILGAFSPLMAFLVWNAPPLTAVDQGARTTHSIILLALVGMLAMAGIAGNVRLLQLLRELSGSPANARRTLIAWLAGNLLLGSQLSWILRPFVGHPSLPVEFLRAEAFNGNFFESVFRTIQHLIS